MMRYLGVVVLLACLHPVASATPRTVSVAHVDGEYVVIAEFEVAAPRDATWRVLTDYENLTRLSDSILESRVVSTEDGVTLVDTVSRRCLGPLCRKVRHRQLVTEYPPTDILAETEPESSDFRSGSVHWMLSPTDAGTTILRYEMHISPSFFVPPLVGTAMLRRGLLRETHAIISGIEHEASR